MRTLSFRSVVSILALFAACPGDARPVDATPPNGLESVEGVVRTLAEIGREGNVPGDLAPFEAQLALRTASGRVIPILSDEGGRAFYLDKSLRNRELRLKIQPTGNFPAAMVIQAEVWHEGRWRVPQYYCDVCTIAVRYPQICLCCQGPMEFRFKPER